MTSLNPLLSKWVVMKMGSKQMLALIQNQRLSKSLTNILEKLSQRKKANRASILIWFQILKMRIVYLRKELMLADILLSMGVLELFGNQEMRWSTVFPALHGTCSILTSIQSLQNYSIVKNFRNPRKVYVQQINKF